MESPVATDKKRKEIEAENRYLKEAISALRDALEEKEIQSGERVQQAILSANDEINQLKATIQAVRDEMESQRAAHGASLQAARRDSRDEINELKKTIQLLRDQLEECNGK